MSDRPFPWPAPDASAPVTGDNDSHSVQIAVDAVNASMRALAGVMEALHIPSAETRAMDAYGTLADWQAKPNPTPRDNRIALRALLSLLDKPAARALLALGQSTGWRVELSRVMTPEARNRETARRHDELGEQIARKVAGTRDMQGGYAPLFGRKGEAGMPVMSAAAEVAPGFHMDAIYAAQIFRNWMKRQRNNAPIGNIRQAMRHGYSRAHPWMATPNPLLARLPHGTGRPRLKS